MNTLSEERKHLLHKIYGIVAKRGPKSTNMDLVASELGISKRTLYELFPSKTEMLLEVVDLICAEIDLRTQKLLQSAPNTLIGLYRTMMENNRFMVETGVAFFKDIEFLYPELRDHKTERDLKHYEGMLKMIRKGIEEGVIRPDLNYEILLKMLGVQIAALKRSEDLFPPEITFAEAASTILKSFLRSIATKKGFEMLEEEDSNLSENNNITLKI